VHYESQEIPGLVIDVDRAPGDKCERCWMRRPTVGASAEHPGLCDRCVAVVGA
jgi:isoleucyl-tRNA synthetase